MSEKMNADHDVEVKDVEEVKSALPEISKQAPEIVKLVTELERQLKLARGTGDQEKAAAEAKASIAGETKAAKIAQISPRMLPKPLDIRERIKTALLHESLNVPQLAKTLAEPAGKVAEVIRQLRHEKAIYNVGIADNPSWTWRIGDGADTATVKLLVRRLISERPFTTRELGEATGVKLSRIGGALIDIQRSSALIVDLGQGRAGRWFLISDKARDARLQPKPYTKAEEEKEGD